jgi:hypothetical protein
VGRIWSEYHADKLSLIGFKASLINDCVFYQDDIIFMAYVNDGIFLGKEDTQLKKVICKIQETELNINNQGHPADYVSINIKKMTAHTYQCYHQ